MLPVWDVKVRRPFGDWDVVSLFNWEPEPAEISVGLDELGLDPAQPRLVYDCWNRALTRGVRDRVTATVPGHGNALLAVYADAGRPQVVYSDRHLVQQAIGIDDLQWNEATNVLSGIVHLVGTDPTELVIALPDGAALVSANADAGITLTTRTEADHCLVLTLQGAETQQANWSMQF